LERVGDAVRNHVGGCARNGSCGSRERRKVRGTFFEGGVFHVPFANNGRFALGTLGECFLEWLGCGFDEVWFGYSAEGLEVTEGGAGIDVAEGWFKVEGSLLVGGGGNGNRSHYRLLLLNNISRPFPSRGTAALSLVLV
jgi:hypothetical protein